MIITDVCLCQYTDHGHCGVVQGKNIDNDASLDLLAKTALFPMPKAGGRYGGRLRDMMDGRGGGNTGSTG